MKKTALILSLLAMTFAYGGKIPELQKIDHEMRYADDLDFKYLLKAIERQEENYSGIRLYIKLQFGNRTIKRKHLQESLIAFKKEVIATLKCFQKFPKADCYKSFNEQMNRKFEAYSPIPLEWERGFKSKQTLFTAYYSPDLHGSRTKTKIYKYPIYGKPKSTILQKATSDEINYENKLSGKGLELFYVKESLFDVWLLQVQGGGRVQVKNQDGSTTKYYISYDGSNKQAFQMLYKYMLAQGMLIKGSTGVPEQREYFNKHPEDQRKILASCPSFIFFKVTKDEPLGVHNIPLTEKRSIATDYRRLEEYGIINFIQTKKPITRGVNTGKMKKFSRFFLNQDTGGAIKGNARVDLYFGYGQAAELSAYSIHNLGQQYYIILK